MLSVFICFLQGSEGRAYTPNCCDLRMLRPPILPYCCSTGTRVILEIGSISLAMLRQVSPWQHWIVAVRQDYQKMEAGSPATHSMDILFVDLMMR